MRHGVSFSPPRVSISPFVLPLLETAEARQLRQDAYLIDFTAARR